MLEDDAAWGSAIQSAEYWEARYARDAAGSGAGNFEWYVSYEQVEGLLEACLRRGGSVLEIGCGNSELALGLHRARSGQAAGMDRAARSRLNQEIDTTLNSAILAPRAALTAPRDVHRRRRSLRPDPNQPRAHLDA